MSIRTIIEINHDLSVHIDMRPDDFLEKLGAFPQLDVRPIVGDSIHYWQDGTEESAGGEGLNRRDYVVVKVEHDLRFMPGRRGGSPMYVHSLNVYLRKVTP